MTKTDHQSITPKHPDEAELIAYLDGELPAEEKPQVAAHLESCWLCRSQLQAVERRIDRFLQVRQTSLAPDELPPSGPLVMQFRRRLHEHIETGSEEHPRAAGWARRARNFFANLTPQLPHSRTAYVAAGLAAMLLLTALFDPFGWRRVSADELLRRADLYETQHEQSASRVVRARLQMERINLITNARRSIGDIKIARDHQSRAVHLVTQFAAAKEQTVPDRDQLNAPEELKNEMTEPVREFIAARRWFPEVSTASYRRLIAGARRVEATDGNSAGNLEVRHWFAESNAAGITRTALRLDAETYAPLSISIFTAAEEYRFTRLSLELLERTPEMARLFAVETETAVKSAAKPAPTAMPSPTAASTPVTVPSPLTAARLNYFNSTASDTEAAVAFALHQAGADLGEEINVFPMFDGSVRIEGLVDGASRREILTRQLSALRLPVEIAIFTLAELRAGNELHDPPDRMADNLPDKGPSNPRQPAPVITLGNLGGGQMPLYPLLAQRFAQSSIAAERIPREVAAFANEAVNLSRRSVFYAWALKKLEVQFSERRAARLSAAARSQVGELRARHVRAIAAAARQLFDDFALVAPEPAATARAAPVNEVNAPVNEKDTATLFRLVTEQNDLIRALLTTTGETTDTAGNLARLFGALRQLQQ